MSEEKKSKPGRIVMLEGVAKYRGCMTLRKGSVQRLDKDATKELLKDGKAEVYEDYAKRTAAEAKTEASKTTPKPKPKEDPKGPTAPSPGPPKEDPKGPTTQDPKKESK